MTNYRWPAGSSLAWIVGFVFLGTSAFAQEAEGPVPGPAEPLAQPSSEASDGTAPAAPPADKPPAAGQIAPNRDFMDVRGGLTSDEAAEKAASYSQSAEVAREDINVAKAAVTQTTFNYAPRVTLTASYTRQSVPQQQSLFGDVSLVGTNGTGTLGPGDTLFAIDGAAFNLNPIPNQWYLNAGVIVPISDYLLNMSQAFAGANAAKKSAELNEKAARVNAAATARLAYYDWVRARLKMTEADQSISRAKAQKKTLENLYQAGRVPRADVLRQDAFLANAELNLRRAETQEAISREQLHVMMTGGKGAAPSWSVGEDVTEKRPGDEVPAADLERLQQEAVESRLEIRALEDTVYALQKQSHVEKTQGYPRVEGFGNLTYANPNPRFIPQENEWNSSWDVGVRMIWTLNEVGAKRAAAKSTDAEIAKVRAQRQQLKDALRTEVISAYRSAQEAELARESSARGVASAEASYEDRVRLFEAGKATSFDVLDAETTLVGARLNLIEAHVAMRMARVRLDHALGRDVDGVVKAHRKREN